MAMGHVTAFSEMSLTAHDIPEKQIRNLSDKP